MSRIAVVGSRDYHNHGAVIAFVDSLPLDTTIVSGGASGVDTLAVRRGRDRGLPAPMVIFAEWALHGKAAGPIRNAVIVRESDSVVAFWDGSSRGTADVIAKARAAGKLGAVYGPDGGRS